MGRSLCYETGGHATLLEDRADRPTVKVLYEAALLGLLLSMTVDHYQIFSPARLPTMTDVLMNTVGALLGASLQPVEQTRRTARRL